MGFEDFSKQQETKKTSEKRDKFFSIVNEFFGYKVEVGIEKDQKPMRIEIDTTTKKVEAFVTPEGIKAAYEFYKKSENQEKIKSFISSLFSASEESKEYRRKSEERLRQARERRAQR